MKRHMEQKMNNIPNIGKCQSSTAWVKVRVPDMIQLVQLWSYLCLVKNLASAISATMRKLFICLMAMAACSGKLSLEDDVEKRLEEVLEGHMDAWSKVEKNLEVAREERSGFPTIKRKRKKIRACQNMAGGEFLFPSVIYFNFTISVIHSILPFLCDICYLQESSAVQMLSTSSTLLRLLSPWWSTSTTTSTTTTTIWTMWPWTPTMQTTQMQMWTMREQI